MLLLYDILLRCFLLGLWRLRLCLAREVSNETAEKPRVKSVLLFLVALLVVVSLVGCGNIISIQKAIFATTSPCRRLGLQQCFFLVVFYSRFAAVWSLFCVFHVVVFLGYVQYCCLHDDCKRRRRQRGVA